MSLQQKKGYLMILTAGILWGSIGFFTTILKQMGAEAATVAFFENRRGSIDSYSPHAGHAGQKTVSH